MAEANEVVAPRLGLPVLPVVDWPDDDEEPQRGVHWKTVPLTRWTAGRPFVWLDGETTDADRRWVNLGSIGCSGDGGLCREASMVVA